MRNSETTVERTIDAPPRVTHTELRALRNADGKSTFKDKVAHELLQRCDGASLAVFRICLGLVMIWHWYRMTGLIPELSKAPFHFSYIAGLPALNALQLTSLCAAMTFSSGCMMLGVFYRSACAALFAGSLFMLLWDKAYYDNEMYLVTLMSFLMCFAPAANEWSLDPAKDRTVPRWAILAVNVQIALVFFWGGVTKLHTDWILGYPQIFWVMAHSRDQWLGPLLRQKFAIPIITYGAVIIDICLPILLFSKRTLWLGALAVALVYGLNYKALTLSPFVWILLCSIQLFASPSWPRRVADVFRRKRHDTSDVVANGWSLSHLLGNTSGASGGEGDANKSVFNPRSTDSDSGKSAMRAAALSAPNPLVTSALAIYFIVQFCLPARQLFLSENINWTEAAGPFSWAVAHAQKTVEDFEMTQIDPKTKKSTEVGDVHRLTRKQYSAMTQTPALIRDFAHHVANKVEKKTGVRPMIHVCAVESLGMRKAQNLVDPNADLAVQPDFFLTAPWLVPLHK